MEAKKKVLFFLPSGVGGAEKMSINIAKMLDRDQYDVRLIIVGKQVQPVSCLVPADYTCSLLYVYNIWDFGFTKLCHLLRKERPYAVFSSIMYLNVRVIMAACFVGGIKIIIRNDNELSVAPPYVRRLVKTLYHKADFIIAQQEEMGEEIKSILPPEDFIKIKVLHNPVDTSLIEGKLSCAVSPYFADSSKNFVCVASVTFRKGQDVLLKAFNSLREELPAAQLYLVGSLGDKGFVKKLRDYISSKGMNDCVHFVGYTDNPYPWVKYADCFVLPSRLEGLPNALIEAQFLGVPVVATESVPVIRRLVEQGLNGYTVGNEDVLAMKKAMMAAISLKHIQMNYHPATKEDYEALFS